MQHTAAKAEVWVLHDICPLGLRNELNVESLSRVRLKLVLRSAKFGLAGAEMCSGCCSIDVGW